MPQSEYVVQMKGITKVYLWAVVCYNMLGWL